MNETTKKLIALHIDHLRKEIQLEREALEATHGRIRVLTERIGSLEEQIAQLTEDLTR